MLFVSEKMIAMPGSRQLREGQRVVGVPWPSAEGEGTWQQYVNVPFEHLVRPAAASACSGPPHGLQMSHSNDFAQN